MNLIFLNSDFLNIILFVFEIFFVFLAKNIYLDKNVETQYISMELKYFLIFIFIKIYLLINKVPNNQSDNFANIKKIIFF